MIKKMMLLATAIAALAAFAMPAVANAQQLYEDGSGPLEEGAEITATSTDLKTHTLLGTLECAKVTLHLTVGINEANTAAANAGTGNITADKCQLVNPEFTTGLTITNASAHLHLGPGVTGTAGLTFVTDFNPPVSSSCDFATTGTGASVSWTTDTDIIKVTAPVSAAGCGPAELTGNFTLETSNGTPVKIP